VERDVQLVRNLVAAAPGFEDLFEAHVFNEDGVLPDAAIRPSGQNSRPVERVTTQATQEARQRRRRHRPLVEEDVTQTVARADRIGRNSRPAAYTHT
jgi:hypothetical protein